MLIKQILKQDFYQLAWLLFEGIVCWMGGEGELQARSNKVNLIKS